MEEAKRKIVFISSWYPGKYRPFLGIFVKRQAAAVAERCDVSALFVSSGEKFEWLESVEDGVYTIRVYFKKIKSLIPLISQLQRLSRYLSAWKKAVELYEEKKGRPDLIHSNIVLPASIIAAKLKRKWKIPYIISEHWSGYLPADGRYKGLVMKTLTRYAVRNASAIITVSGALKKNMLDAGLANNYFVISNIVDTKNFSIPEQPLNKGKYFTFMHVSSLDDMEKNVSGIIRSFNIVYKEHPAAKLVITGEGENKVALEGLIKLLGLADAVSFTGAKSGGEVAALMQQADAFVLFSNFETQGVALLEALCCGIPGIATSMGGPAEYINPVNGILIEPGNEQQLIGAMIKMMENKGSYNPVSIRNSVVDMVSEKNVAQKITEVYNTVVKK